MKKLILLCSTAILLTSTPLDAGVFSLDPNLTLTPEIGFAGTHVVFASSDPLTEAGVLKIKKSGTELSLTVYNLQIRNWNGTTCYLPSFNVLKDFETAYTFFVDAKISYHGAKNCLPFESNIPVQEQLETRLFLLNTGEQIYLAWTVFDSKGDVLLDETFYSRKKPKKACNFLNQSLICI
jgi:hypothetical protein